MTPGSCSSASAPAGGWRRRATGPRPTLRGRRPAGGARGVAEPICRRLDERQPERSSLLAEHVGAPPAGPDDAGADRRRSVSGKAEPAQSSGASCVWVWCGIRPSGAALQRAERARTAFNWAGRALKVPDAFPTAGLPLSTAACRLEPRSPCPPAIDPWIGTFHRHAHPLDGASLPLAALRTGGAGQHPASPGAAAGSGRPGARGPCAPSSFVRISIASRCVRCVWRTPGCADTARSDPRTGRLPPDDPARTTTSCGYGPMSLGRHPERSSGQRRLRIRRTAEVALAAGYSPAITDESGCRGPGVRRQTAYRATTPEAGRRAGRAVAPGRHPGPERGADGWPGDPAACPGTFPGSASSRCWWWTTAARIARPRKPSEPARG